MNKIEIRKLCKAFGSRVVLDNLDLSVKEKESLVVLGRSGMGKSVLIKNISTLLEPDSGSIKIDGEEITNLREREKFGLMNKFGYLFQGGALFDSMSVWENVAFKLLNNQKIGKKRAKQIAIEKLKIVDLDGSVADLLPVELSGGMQKRVSLARAIACDPEIIFFDEPTTGLDPITAETINDLIIKTVKIVGATAITITHDIHSAKRISDRIVLLNSGKICWEGNSNNINAGDNEIIEKFMCACA
ncbi:MAG: ATP-binding cassette domain-containing protein [Rickettsiales bacterium]|nr:ATP-binding cassette domain-containing protein [Rickettsiales bacterium]